MSNSAVVKTLIGPQGPQGASGLQPQGSVAGSTGVIAAAAAANISVAMPKVAGILIISTNYPAWVRIYQTSAARTNDASRLITQDPISGTGVVCEVLTGGSLEQVMMPVPVFSNDDLPLDNVAYLAVTNYDSVARDITTTITYQPMSA